MSAIRSLAVLVPSWNGRAHLETCLEALEHQREPGVAWRVLVFDNGSRDGTVDWLRAVHPRVEVVASPANLGFCSAMNRLVARADADAVALLNNDTRPQADWLAALYEALASAPSDVAAVAGKIVDWAGERLDFGRGIMTFDAHAFQLDYKSPLNAARVPTAGTELPFPCGGNMLIRRADFAAVGGFDERYFAYLEDVDLGWRLWAAGHRVIAAPEAVVHHRSMATSALLGADHRGFLFERNAFRTAYKNYQDGLWQQLMPAILLTLQHRTQTLLVQNNPGGATLTLDPYAGHIADTRGPSASASPSSGSPPRGPGAARLSFSPAGMLERWRRYGGRELLLRGLRKAWSRLPDAVSSRAATGRGAVIEDGRTIAQLRAITNLLSGLDGAAEARQRVQSRRRRSDREIFERFPPAIVATYPGDARLFTSPGFRAWMPNELPTVDHTLHEVMPEACPEAAEG